MPVSHRQPPSDTLHTITRHRPEFTRRSAFPQASSRLIAHIHHFNTLHPCPCGMPPRRAGAAPQAAPPAAHPQPHRQGATVLQPPPQPAHTLAAVVPRRGHVDWGKWTPRIALWGFLVAAIGLVFMGVAFWPSLVEARKSNSYSQWANNFAYYQACVSVCQPDVPRTHPCPAFPGWTYRTGFGWVLLISWCFSFHS